MTWSKSFIALSELALI